MSIFAIGYYALLLVVSCLASYFNKRTIFMMVFSLTLISFVLGIIGGVGALKGVAICAALLGLTAMIAYAFREFLIQLAESNLGSAFSGNQSLTSMVLGVPLVIFLLSAKWAGPHINHAFGIDVHHCRGGIAHHRRKTQADLRRIVGHNCLGLGHRRNEQQNYG